jgi:hypothetical protein
VYVPLSETKYYAVVIGSYLSLSEARSLKREAIKDGLPPDTYLWRYQASELTPYKG